jgi:hypothetical protein
MKMNRNSNVNQKKEKKFLVVSLESVMDYGEIEGRATIFLSLIANFYINLTRKAKGGRKVS